MGKKTSGRKHEGKPAAGGAHAHDHAHAHDGPPPSFEDELRTAYGLIAAGDVGHATHHVACAVADGADRPACAELIETYAVAAGPDPLIHVPAEGLWFGLGALRAHLLARAMRHREAVPLLLRCLAAVPTAPFASWLPLWLAMPGVLDGLDPDDTARALLDCCRQEPLGALLVSHARRIHEAHPDHDLLAFAAVKLARMCWRTDDAIALGQAAMARGPRPKTAIGVAGARREAGDLAGAVDAFREASRLAPDDAAIHLDIGDLSLELGRLDDALAAYDAALAMSPDDAWAAPSRRYVRWKQTGAEADLQAFYAWAHDHSENQRAGALTAMILEASDAASADGDDGDDGAS